MNYKLLKTLIDVYKRQPVEYTHNIQFPPYSKFVKNKCFPQIVKYKKKKNSDPSVFLHVSTKLNVSFVVSYFVHNQNIS